VNHSDVFGQQILNSILEDRMGMAAAYFHDLERLGSQSRDLVCESPRDFTGTVFVYVFHLNTPKRQRRGAAWPLSSAVRLASPTPLFKNFCRLCLQNIQRGGEPPKEENPIGKASLTALDSGEAVLTSPRTT
jgi:hypothetical protein